MKKDNIKKETLKIVDEIADELVDILLSSKKFSGISEKAEKTETVQKKDSEELMRLRKRIKSLKNILLRHISQFRTSTVELERELSEKIEDLKREIEENNISTESQIGEIRNKVRTLRNEVNKLKRKVKK